MLNLVRIQLMIKFRFSGCCFSLCDDIAQCNIACQHEQYTDLTPGNLEDDESATGKPKQRTSSLGSFETETWTVTSRLQTHQTRNPAWKRQTLWCAKWSFFHRNLDDQELSTDADLGAWMSVTHVCDSVWVCVRRHIEAIKKAVSSATQPQTALTTQLMLLCVYPKEAWVGWGLFTLWKQLTLDFLNCLSHLNLFLCRMWYLLCSREEGWTRNHTDKFIPFCLFSSEEAWT